MLAFFGIIWVAVAHAHNCTSKELQTLPRDSLRLKCGAPRTVTSTVSSNQCMYAFSQSGCLFRLSNFIPGVANVSGQSLGCTPLSHAFTWASSISPANGVAYVMGGSSSSYRNLYTVNITTGLVIYQPTVGYIYDTAYFIAADQRPNGRLYGAWNLEAGYRLAEIDPRSGQVKQYFMDPTWTPAPGLKCNPSCGLSTDCGYFSLPDNSYVTSWSCSQTNVVVRVNVDTLKVSLVKWSGSYDYFIVNSVTGFAYAATTAYSVSRINEPSGTLTTVITIPNQNVVLFDLTVTSTGVCFPRAQDTKFGRAHPQDEDFVCFDDSLEEGQESTQLYSVPFMDQFDMPYATQAVMGSC